MDVAVKPFKKGNHIYHVSNKQTFSSVVIARVAMLRLTSVIKFSRSKLQVVTDMGWAMATLFKVRTAANLRVGRGELKKSWSTKGNTKE